LLYLHPPAFRKRFGAEMLWIFDQSVEESGAARLLLDGLLSLLRRWLLRSAIWRVLAALAGACATMVAGFMVMPKPPSSIARQSIENPEAFLLLSGIATVLVLSLTLALSISWFRFSRRRCA